MVNIKNVILIHDERISKKIRTSISKNLIYKALLMKLEYGSIKPHTFHK